MKFEKMIKILIIDDNPISCIDIQAVLKTRIEEMTEIQFASSLQVLSELAEVARPDLVIFGLHKIFQADPVVPLVVYYDDFLFESMTSFSKKVAVGFISKNRIAAELHSCVLNVLKGQFYMCEETTLQMLEVLAAKKIPSDPKRKSNPGRRMTK
jgi:DNA-binding NarL/FixJ family response regulator